LYFSGTKIAPNAFNNHLFWLFLKVFFMVGKNFVRICLLFSHFAPVSFNNYLLESSALRVEKFFVPFETDVLLKSFI